MTGHTLLVSPFAPYRDGIAAYALQELRELRRGGATVDVLSPLPSAARWHLPLGGPAGAVALARRAADHERTIIQFGPEMLFGRCRHPAERVAVWTALAATTRSTALDVRLHEIEYGPLERNPVERRMARVALGRAARLTVHTEAERRRLDDLLGLGAGVELVDHGQNFAPTVVRTKDEARRDLGLAADRFLFVSIGFLQHHKGFDVAVDAIAGLHLPGVELHIVGSARVDDPDILAYVRRLERQATAVPGVHIHERFVSDEAFDLWLQAADAIVLPYREIWSSGVVERARLFNRPILASDLPQLRDQAPAGTMFAADATELTVAMEKTCAAAGYNGAVVAHAGGDERRRPPVGIEPWDVDPARPDRSAIEAQIVARASASHRVDAADRRARTGDRRPAEALLALPPLSRPQPTSTRPGVALVKRLVDRAIDWRVDPLARRLAELEQATTEALLNLEPRLGDEDRP